MVLAENFEDQSIIRKNKYYKIMNSDNTFFFKGRL